MSKPVHSRRWRALPALLLVLSLGAGVVHLWQHMTSADGDLGGPSQHPCLLCSALHVGSPIQQSVSATAPAVVRSPILFCDRTAELPPAERGAISSRAPPTA